MSRHVLLRQKTLTPALLEARLASWATDGRHQLRFLLRAAKKNDDNGKPSRVHARAQGGGRNQLSAETGGATFSFHRRLIVNRFCPTRARPSSFSNRANAANAANVAAKTEQVLTNTIKVGLQVSIKPLKTHFLPFTQLIRFPPPPPENVSSAFSLLDVPDPDR